jgi:hypothetical protein
VTHFSRCTRFLTLVRCFIYCFNRCFIRSFILCFIRSFIRCFIRSFIRCSDHHSHLRDLITFTLATLPPATLVTLNSHPSYLATHPGHITTLTLAILPAACSPRTHHVLTHFLTDVFTHFFTHVLTHSYTACLLASSRFLCVHHQPFYVRSFSFSDD